MSTVHFVLQGKGGVGKSLIASLLYQYLHQQGVAVTGVDTDPVNATFSGYKTLSVQSLDIMDGDDIDRRRFDSLMEIILQQTEENHIVIDNGASTFLPLCSYLKDNAALELLDREAAADLLPQLLHVSLDNGGQYIGCIAGRRNVLAHLFQFALELLQAQRFAVTVRFQFGLLCGQEGHAVLLHTVMTGGQAVVDTASGLKTLATSFPSASIVVWLNRYFGDIAMNGKVFEDFKVYQEHYSQFRSIIEVPARKQSTFGKDLEALLSRRETFEAAIHSNQPVMVRQRLKTFWAEVSREVDKAQLIEAL